MMKICPECGGKIPEAETECPICGCLQEACFQESSADGAAFGESSEKRSAEQKCGCFHRFLLELFIFVFALFAAGVIVLATDFKGARTELRRMCMTDSGDGSGADTELNRIMVKHYILVFLDFFDHGGTGESTRINPDAFNRKHSPESDPEKKMQQKRSEEPLMLPPSPPEVKPLELPEMKQADHHSQDGEVFPETVLPEKKNDKTASGL